MEEDTFAAANARPGTPFPRDPESQVEINESDIDSKDEDSSMSSNQDEEEKQEEEHKNQDNNNVAPEQEELQEPVVAQTWKCEQCPASFNKKYNLNKHVKQVHGDRERKHMRHIKKDKKVVCPICSKEYTHSASLKDHIIKNH